jgi:hypothetical protein
MATMALPFPYISVAATQQIIGRREVKLNDVVGRIYYPMYIFGDIFVKCRCSTRYILAMRLFHLEVVIVFLTCGILW